MTNPNLPDPFFVVSEALHRGDIVKVTLGPSTDPDGILAMRQGIVLYYRDLFGGEIAVTEMKRDPVHGVTMTFQKMSKEPED